MRSWTMHILAATAALCIPAMARSPMSFWNLLVCLVLAASTLPAAERPNVLWITSEDNGPQLGCYGDEYADTPHIDGLARRGLVYLNAWSNAPVCAPARTTIISGLYPTATGSEHMRSVTRLPEGMRMYPQFLREAGYYSTNNSKEDYNLRKPGKVWDDSSPKAHWRNREPGQPFFAVFNFTTSHESQVRKRPHKLVHDPEKVRLPAYHPDHPAVRRDWAQYYDKLTEMDRQVGAVLAELEADGLVEDTIVFYYGDHGAGMPRCKRWPYNSGLRVPLVIHVPEKFRELAPEEYAPGGRSERLVGFIDLAPALLSIAGIRPPEWMQGRAFMGKFAAPEPEFAYGFRGRMDERYDLVRSVRDKRYIYVRNYMPHRIYGQYVSYMFETPATAVWKELYDRGELEPPRTFFWEVKPPEELYDLESDPDEVRNLAGSEDLEHRRALERLRRAERRWVLDVRDVGFLPEGEIHGRSGDRAPYEMARDGSSYDVETVVRAADRASRPLPGDAGDVIALLDHDDSAVRYWGAIGVLVRGKEVFPAARDALQKARERDPSPYVRALACEALGRFGSDEDARQATSTLLELARVDRNGLYAAMLALNALDALDGRARTRRAAEKIRALPESAPGIDGRMRSYIPRLVEKILADLEE